MERFLEKIVSIKFIRSRYFIISVIFIVWMLFFDNYSLSNHMTLNKQIKDLENSKKYYEEEIMRDRKMVEELKNPLRIEEYARENYFMKRANEDLFIIEFENDSTKTDKKQ